MNFKNNEDIKSLDILRNTLLYTAYADDKTFFKKKIGFNKKIAKYNFFTFIFFKFKTKLLKMLGKQPGKDYQKE